ncbi:hypothetical protein SlGVgp057 [Spodoptera litura granulovirus]|uniref:P10 n=1 Tax=Spodoptera litura granulovirus TaxID=359919 RepID=A5IZQ9_9BBAC|nr:hypothetical protein SlGVgp057 [Spodoptera litura granulovirus]ABQ52000.1 hypothetical protein SlGVgp057 [Spodoptera litura granulovirus]
MSLKDLYNEIIKTQQDIAVTYSRLVAVETELKRSINKNNPSGDNIDHKFNAINDKLNTILQQFYQPDAGQKLDSGVDEVDTTRLSLD